jgi:hypothetical protein
MHTPPSIEEQVDVELAHLPEYLAQPDNPHLLGLSDAEYNAVFSDF